MSGHILLIDHSAKRAEDLALQLGDARFLVDISLTSREGIRKIARTHPDAVLLSTELPDQCSFDTCCDIRAHPQLAYAPIFMFDTDPSESDHDRAFSAGAISLLDLPKEIAQLRTRLPSLIRGHRLMSELDLHLPNELPLGLAEAPNAFQSKPKQMRLSLDLSPPNTVNGLEQFDFLTTDENPECYLIEGLDRLQAHFSLKNPRNSIPVVFLTDAPDKETVKEALLLGARDVLDIRSATSRLAASAAYHVRGYRHRSHRETEIADVLKSAYRDPVTGVFSRHYAERYLDRLTAFSSDPPVYGVMMVDLDHFKTVNDRFGHIEGDQALRAAARAMESILREDSTLFRWGGDEFLITAPGLDADNIALLGIRLIDALKQIYLPDGSTLSASFGAVSLKDRATWSPTELIAAADEALFRTKACGRGHGEVA